MKIYLHKFKQLNIGYSFEIQYKNETRYLTLIMENNELSNIVEMKTNVFCSKDPDYTFWFNQDLLNKLANLDNDIEKLVKIHKILSKNLTEEELELKKKEIDRLKEIYWIVKKELKKIINEKD